MAALANIHSRSEPTIVGVGASAGGLEAFTQLLQRIPPDTGLAFVLIQHLARTHPSLLGETLAKTTMMPVRQVEHAMPVESNHVYVIAPNTDLVLRQGQLIVSPRASDGTSPHLPVDGFLRSLAAELGSRAIGVVLSGAASDGTEGLRAIHTADGTTFVQEPNSAKFSSMPQSAIDAGVVDFCMDIPQLADELERLGRQSNPPPGAAAEVALPDDDGSLQRALFERILAVVGVDFSEFKPSTVKRRLARRLSLHKMSDLRTYLALVDSDPQELHALFEDMLIHVTSFFRDSDVFDALRARVFPELLERKARGAVMRAWVAGCSTGEEAFSLAIEWLELVGDKEGAPRLQIFGSDLSEIAIQKARSGVFSESAMRGVSDVRRQRFFGKTDGGYRVHKNVRDMCVFVRHDLLRDPPFSKLDLVSCRNVLIYFDQTLQRKVVPTLHYCLNQPGFLVLGRSENVSGYGQLFAEVDKVNKIFMRVATVNNLRFAPRSALDARPPGMLADPRQGFVARGDVFATHLDSLLLARYCPAGVLVNENLDVVLFRGRTGAFLQAAPGQPQTNLIGMARSGLVAALRLTIAQAKTDMVATRCAGVEVDQDGVTKTCDVVVLPFTGLPDSKEPLFIVLFEEPGTPVLPPEAMRRTDAPTDARQGARLEQELTATQVYLHTLIADHGRASGELATANEELVSGNEELQSMNEELETAKEELQSINEELTTLNDELQTRNHEINQINSDLLNFAVAVDIPIVTLDLALRIRRFTPRSSSVLNVTAADIGRPIAELELNVEIPDLTAQIAAVCQTRIVSEREVQDKQGRWHRMQIHPHTADDRVIDGVLLSFVDIDGLKHLIADAQAARSQAERDNLAKDDFLATLSHELRTPLSSMLLNAQRLRAGHFVRRADLERAGEALESATWMQVKLVDDLLDVSRIVAGKLQLECHAVDLSGAVQASIESVSALISAKDLVLEVSLMPALGLIWADRVRTQQIAVNLLTNAIKFTPRGGRVSVVVDAVSGFARLRVTDTGIGIDAKFVQHAFERFSQHDSSITRTYGGLGLGLALVRHLGELQGGAVHAESKGLGQGSSFTVTFPLARSWAAPEDAPAPQRVEPLDRPGKTQHYAALSGLRVLVVDDDLRTREAVLEVLALTGAHVKLAASAAEGTALVDSFKPQVILCDIAMPGEDGYTFIRRLRANELGGDVAIPALALTALAAQDDRRRALAAGFQLHLAKPIDIDRLRDAVLELSSMEMPPALRV